MTLFDECKIALKDDFHILDEEEKSIAMMLFSKYVPNDINDLYFRKDFYDIEFEDIKKFFSDEKAYVLVDILGIPLFRSNISLISENIYDVMCLSVGTFIFNENWLMMNRFPEDVVRVFYMK